MSSQKGFLDQLDKTVLVSLLESLIADDPELLKKIESFAASSRLETAKDGYDASNETEHSRIESMVSKTQSKNESNKISKEESNKEKKKKKKVFDMSKYEAQSIHLLQFSY